MNEPAINNEDHLRNEIQYIRDENNMLKYENKMMKRSVGRRAWCIERIALRPISYMLYLGADPEGGGGSFGSYAE